MATSFDKINFQKMLLEGLRVELSELQTEQFIKYYNFLLEYNEHTNLTRIKPEDVARLHFYDSMTSLKYIDYKNIGSLVDIGSGAGFPGVPLKIIFPQLKVLLLDSRRKKTEFLNLLFNKLDLKEINSLHARAEDLANDEKYQGKFDIITARAVSGIKTLLGILVPFKNKNGKIVLYKSQQTEMEIREARNEIKKLKLNYEVNDFELPVSGEKRSIIIFK